MFLMQLASQAEKAITAAKKAWCPGVAPATLISAAEGAVGTWTHGAIPDPLRRRLLVCLAEIGGNLAASEYAAKKRAA